MLHDRARRHPLCPLAHRLPPYRRRAHRAVQLALCARPRRQDAAADRGHRPRALDRGRDRRDPRRADLARPRLGRRVVYQFSRAARHREVAEAAAGRRQGLSLLRDARKSSPRCARRRAPRAAPRLYDGRWRDRDPARRRRASRRSSASRRRSTGETVDRGPGAGPRRLAEREPRRPRPAALRRHADLHARGRRRRPRHGRHPHHPRRRPPHQRARARSRSTRRSAGRCR